MLNKIFAADGIALGAAATTSHAATEMIVFLAIMLHKVSRYSSSLYVALHITSLLVL